MAYSQYSQYSQRRTHSQVSHHPPIGAAHADAPNWSYDIVSAPTTKFLGNSIDIFPVGRSRIHLKRKDGSDDGDDSEGEGDR